jgi:hypothetical protein
MGEQRRERPALNLPALSFDAQQSVGQAGRENAALDRVLSVVCGIIQQDALDGLRIVDQKRVGKWQPEPGDRLAEEIGAPAFERISPQSRQ